MGCLPVHEGEPGSRLLIVVPLLLPASETQTSSHYSIMYLDYSSSIMKNNQEYCCTQISFSLAPDPNDMLECPAQTIFRPVVL